MYKVHKTQSGALTLKKIVGENSEVVSTNLVQIQKSLSFEEIQCWLDVYFGESPIEFLKSKAEEKFKSDFDEKTLEEIVEELDLKNFRKLVKQGDFLHSFSHNNIGIDGERENETLRKTILISEKLKKDKLFGEFFKFVKDSDYQERFDFYSKIIFVLKNIENGDRLFLKDFNGFDIEEKDFEVDFKNLHNELVNSSNSSVGENLEVFARRALAMEGKNRKTLELAITSLLIFFLKGEKDLNSAVRELFIEYDFEHIFYVFRESGKRDMFLKINGDCNNRLVAIVLYNRTVERLGLEKDFKKIDFNKFSDRIETKTFVAKKIGFFRSMFRKKEEK